MRVAGGALFPFWSMNARAVAGVCVCTGMPALFCSHTPVRPAAAACVLYYDS